MIINQQFKTIEYIFFLQNTNNTNTNNSSSSSSSNKNNNNKKMITEEDCNILLCLCSSINRFIQTHTDNMHTYIRSHAH